uniref:Chaperonin GroEL n=1 Tax=uncultured virus TaxID=340016 RepID=A0A240F756_9VIRU|nr:chaperonin GroEL [uncultured virus]
MSKVYHSGDTLNQKVIDGVNKLADNVATTLGPKGRNVLLKSKGRTPVITKDGVTVAKFVDLEDPTENAAAYVIKQASVETNSSAGDGTTTSTVLAREIINNSQRYLAAGCSPTELKRGMDKALSKIKINLKELARPILSEEEVSHVASISANNDKEIGKLIATAVDQAGKDGSISVEEAKSVETSLDMLEGFRFDSGFISSQFITDERRSAVRYDDALVMVTDESINTVEQILPILEPVARSNSPFVIVADNIQDQALAALIMNATRGTMKVAAVKAPAYGEERRNILKDLATSIGATFISREGGKRVQEAKLSDLGTVRSVEILKYESTFVGGQGDYDEIEKRIEILKNEIEQTDDLEECERLQGRITRLASGVAIIRVGGTTEVEMIERKHRIEDAIEAVRSAQLEGIVPGGGVALVRACDGLEVDVDNEDQKFGVEIVLKSVEAPIRQMAKNAGLSPDLVVDAVKKEKGEFGYNFMTGEIENLYEIGVVDPVKVTRTALENAISVSSTLITTNYAIVESE